MVQYEIHKPIVLRLLAFSYISKCKIDFGMNQYLQPYGLKAWNFILECRYEKVSLKRRRRKCASTYTFVLSVYEMHYGTMTLWTIIHRTITIATAS